MRHPDTPIGPGLRRRIRNDPTREPLRQASFVRLAGTTLRDFRRFILFLFDCRDWRLLA
jgi:hypothetical protein